MSKLLAVLPLPIMKQKLLEVVLSLFKMLKMHLLQISLGKLIWDFVVVVVVIVEGFLEALSLDAGNAVLQAAAAVL